MVIAVMVAGCAGQKPVSPLITTTPVPVVTETTVVKTALPSPLAGNWELMTMAIQDGTAVTVPTT